MKCRFPNKSGPRKGEPCEKWAIKGRTRCKLHGGKTPVGAANGYYRHGRYSKFLPVRMAAKYREADKDPNLLSLREEVKALDARISDVLTRVDTGESGSLWQRVQETHEDFRVAKLLPNTPANVQKMQAALAKLEDAIGAGAQDWAAWNQVTDLWEKRRKLVDTEVKLSLARKYYISHSQGMIMMAQMTDAVIRHAQAILPVELMRKYLTAVTVDLQQIATSATGAEPVYALPTEVDADA